MHHFSFSQYQDFKQCPKKWAFKQLDKIKGVPSTALLKGRRIHEEIENGLKSDSRSKHVMWAKNTLKDLGIKKYGCEVKLQKNFGGITIVGKADILSGDTIVDWKTGKRPENYDPKTVDQLLLYGYLTDEAPKYLVGAYVEHDYYFEVIYDENDAKQVVDDILTVASKAAALKSEFSSGHDIVGKPTRLCRWCEYHDICPDNFDLKRKELGHVG